MQSILVYEFLSAGGLSGDPAEAELMPLGVSMRDAIARDLLRLPVERVRHVSVAECAGAPLCGLVNSLGVQKAAAMARLGGVKPRPGQDALAFLAEQARSHDAVWVVAPETGALLQRCREQVGDARWLGSDAAALRTCGRKSLTLAALQAHGVRTPLDVDAGSDALAWVVKPDDGAGAVDTWRFTDRTLARAALKAAQARGEPVTLQPWVDGEAMSLSLLCDPGSAVAQLLSLNRQQIEVDAAGHLAFAGVQRLITPAQQPQDPRWPALQALADAALRAIPGLRGFVGIDLVWHPAHGPVAIEVNARVSCAYVGLSAALGRNLAEATLALHRPVASTAPSFSTAEVHDERA